MYVCLYTGPTYNELPLERCTEQHLPWLVVGRSAAGNYKVDIMIYSYVWSATKKDNVLYNKNIALATHVLILPNYNLFTQTAASHLLPNIPLFHPGPVVPLFASEAVAVVFIWWLCVRVAFGMKDWRYRVVLLRWILNLSFRFICQLSNSGLNGCVSSAKLVLSLFVTAFSPLPHLPSHVLVESLFVLFGCIPSPATHSKS